MSLGKRHLQESLDRNGMHDDDRIVRVAAAANLVWMREEMPKYVIKVS
jgi:hypothetical protein